MAHEIRRHIRITASGKRVAVRQHTREGGHGSGQPGTAVQPAGAAGDWTSSPEPEVTWDDGSGPAAWGEDWRDGEEDVCDGEIVPDDPHEGCWDVRDHGELRAVFPDGHTEPVLDEAPRTEEPRTERELKKAQAQAMVRFSRAPSRAERDAAEADYERVTALLRALSGNGGFADWGDR
jgi:hypothetical protein